MSTFRLFKNRMTESEQNLSFPHIPSRNLNVNKVENLLIEGVENNAYTPRLQI